MVMMALVRFVDDRQDGVEWRSILHSLVLLTLLARGNGNWGGMDGMNGISLLNGIVCRFT